MGTPFIEFLSPSTLDGYDRTQMSSKQPPNISKAFLNAMEVREKVFVEEQKVPIANEFDSDDRRACHWVVYASVNTVTKPEKMNTDGDITTRKSSVTETLPIGTIRLVPFPHAPHPEPGSSYSADALETADDTESALQPPYIVDRATTYHDGTEPYVKLGRLAVLQEYRGLGIAKLLVATAMAWLQQNPTYFNPSVKSMGMENMGATSFEEIPIWKGLMCIHAQVQVAPAWSKWGFKSDEEMGCWIEEDIKHVGMFQRLTLPNEAP